MGIINCTPDSFFPDSRSSGVDQALEMALGMIGNGADMLDIGGESTRPGSASVDAEEQINRVIPAIKAIRSRSEITISIDTSSADVAEAAIDSGANIINDISAFSDHRMAALAAERKVQVILMHMQGTPETMQKNPDYENVIKEVKESLGRYVDEALSAGIASEDIILDPGIGFGKRQEDNLELLGNIDLWRPSQHQILIGLSRKSFLGRILDADTKLNTSRTPLIDSPSVPDDRMNATLAAHAWCLNQGVDILRVHDVRETRQLIAVWEALAWVS